MHIPPGRRRGWPLEVLQRHTRNGAAGGLRSLGLNVGDVALYLAELRLHVLADRRPTSEGHNPRQIVKEHSPRSSAGEFKAARSLHWRRATDAVRGLRRGSSPQHEVIKKTKRPGSISESGPLARELGRYAPTRYLHPGAADPRTAVRATRWPALREGRSAANACWTPPDCDRRETRRARTSDPMPVGCSVRSCLLSRWVPVLGEVLDDSKLVADETGTKQFRRRDVL